MVDVFGMTFIMSIFCAVACATRDLWVLTEIFVGIMILSGLGAIVAHIGWHDFIALPQALWMAIQDRRNKS